MEKQIQEMSYSEFKTYTNARACDGQWDFITALACCDMRRKIDAIKMKGLFKRKSTEKAREKAWQKLVQDTL